MKEFSKDDLVYVINWNEDDGIPEIRKGEYQELTCPGFTWEIALHRIKFGQSTFWTYKDEDVFEAKEEPYNLLIKYHEERICEHIDAQEKLKKELRENPV